MARPCVYKTVDEKKAALARNRRRHAQTRTFKSTQMKWKFGITLEQWEQMFEQQGRVCKSCKSPSPNHKNGWATDHCHRSGAVRGILCQPCNVALGIVKDNPAHLDALKFYLLSFCKNENEPLEKE